MKIIVVMNDDDSYEEAEIYANHIRNALVNILPHSGTEIWNRFEEG